MTSKSIYLALIFLFTLQINSQVLSAPVNLLPSNVTVSSVDLSWDPSPNGETYDIYQDNIFIANTSSTSYQALSLSSATMYVFTVRAKDVFNNESISSNEVAIITLEPVFNYCDSRSNVFDEEWIGRVQLNTIDNFSSNLAYSDFTSMSTVLRQGTQYTISITPIWSPVVWNEGYSVWIDYNKDGDFEDPGEQVWTLNPTQNSIVSGSFTVATTSNLGKTRMRVSMKYNDIPDSCENFTWGEVEDYTVNLVGPSDLVYTNGSWIPNAPSDTSSANDALIIDGNYEIATDISINNFKVDQNATLTISKNGSLVANGNIICNGNMTLESDSNEYSSLIVNGSVVGNVVYKRHVNSVTAGNDLVSPPILGQQFNDFQTVNPNIVSNSSNTLFLFGPFEKPTNAYITYSNTETAKLTASKGYRAASTDNDTFTFEGLVTTRNVSAPVFISGPTTPEWNLIGNPYPSYIRLRDFLSLNNSKFNAKRSGIYGYDGDASNGWTIWNQAYSDANPNAKITPGQGFLVATNTSGISFDFTPTMCTKGNSDDFIDGRQEVVEISHLQLQLSNTSSFYKTDFYFTENATLGLDPNYDSEIFGNTGSFALYSHLVEDNLDKAIGVQSIGNTNLSDLIIPLGVHILEGEQAIFNITKTTLNDGIEVYIEDRQKNIFTLLNFADYAFTTDTDLSGTGRFYLRFSEVNTLGITKDKSSNIKIYNPSASKTIIVKGELYDNAKLTIYDLQGRLITVEALGTNSDNVQTIEASYLSSGTYLVKLQSNKHETVQKILIK